MLSNARINDTKLVLEFISNENPISIRRLVEVPLANIRSISRLSTYESVKDYRLSVSKLSIDIRDHTYVDRNGYLIFELHNLSRALILELDNLEHPAMIFEATNPESLIRTLSMKINRQKRKSA